MKRQRPDNKKIVLGVTGSFGSGKSTVARIFKSFGAEIIDADKIAHRIIKPQTKIYKKIINAFGKNILKEDKSINRGQLARIAFNNKNSLKRLNRIIHPQVIRSIKEKIDSSSKKVIILDAPLLIEAGVEKIVDKLIVVAITRKKQIKRIRYKLGLKRIDILKRINAQIPLRNKVRFADFVIDNNGTIKDTKRQVIRILQETLKQGGYCGIRYQKPKREKNY